LAAIAASLSALRAIERHGGAQIMERAFLGFAALPAPSVDWRAILHISGNASKEDVIARYRALAGERHPDTGGSQEAFYELTAARDAALREIA